LFARKLDDFKTLRRKAVRVIVYKDNNRIEAIKEQEGGKGYAAGFEGLVKYIMGPTSD
jgi:predicted HTH transcriptional regulator